MVYSSRTRKFEDLDFKLVRDLWRRLLKNPYSCFSMQELLIEMKRCGHGRDKTKLTIRTLCELNLIIKTGTKVYRNVEKDEKVYGRIYVYQHSHVFGEFIEKFLSLCKSEENEKGGELIPDSKSSP